MQDARRLHELLRVDSARVVIAKLLHLLHITPKHPLNHQALTSVVWTQSPPTGLARGAEEPGFATRRWSGGGQAQHKGSSLQL